MSQGLRIILPGNAGCRHWHAPQQRPVSWDDPQGEELLCGSLLLPLLGSSVLKPYLPTQGGGQEIAPAAGDVHACCSRIYLIWKFNLKKENKKSPKESKLLLYYDRFFSVFLLSQRLKTCTTTGQQGAYWSRNSWNYLQLLAKSWNDLLHVVRFMWNKWLSDMWSDCSETAVSSWLHLLDLHHQPDPGPDVVFCPLSHSFSHLYPRLI